MPEPMISKDSQEPSNIVGDNDGILRKSERPKKRPPGISVSCILSKHLCFH